MGFARKIKRANTPKVPRCCKMKMSRKMGYDTETHDFYFCENCGKEKWVERSNCGAKMDGKARQWCEIAENIESCEDCGFCAMLERKNNG